MTRSAVRAKVLDQNLTVELVIQAKRVIKRLYMSVPPVATEGQLQPVSRAWRMIKNEVMFSNGYRWWEDNLCS